MSQALQRVAAGIDELDTFRLGDVLAESGYFQDAKGAAQCVVKVLAGRELGLGPVASMTGIYIVKGRVTLSANLIGAAIKRSGRYNYRVRRMTDAACSIEFFEGAESIGVSDFTKEDAKRAGLGGDTWSKFARNMLFARAMSNGAKWYCPDVFAGPVYTPDELGAKVDHESGEVVPESYPAPARQIAPPEQDKEPDPVDAEIVKVYSELVDHRETVRQNDPTLKPLPSLTAAINFKMHVRNGLADLSAEQKQALFEDLKASKAAMIPETLPPVVPFPKTSAETLDGMIVDQIQRLGWDEDQLNEWAHTQFGGDEDWTERSVTQKNAIYSTLQGKLNEQGAAKQ